MEEIAIKRYNIFNKSFEFLFVTKICKMHMICKKISSIWRKVYIIIFNRWNKFLFLCAYLTRYCLVPYTLTVMAVIGNPPYFLEWLKWDKFYGLTNFQQYKWLIISEKRCANTI